MKSFEDFYTSLTSDEQWFALLRMYHEETIRRAATKVWAVLVADKIENIRPMNENRKHVYNTVIKDCPVGDKPRGKEWFQVEQEKKEAEEKKEWVPLTGEARQAKLKEWMEAITKVEMISAVPKMTVKEMIEQGDWRAATPIVPRSEVEKHIVVESHIEKVNNARRKLFLSAFPDATEEEITEYLKKFTSI